MYSISVYLKIIIKTELKKKIPLTFYNALKRTCLVAEI